jgi:hypothetical protein
MYLFHHIKIICILSKFLVIARRLRVCSAGKGDRAGADDGCHRSCRGAARGRGPCGGQEGCGRARCARYPVGQPGAAPSRTDRRARRAGDAVAAGQAGRAQHLDLAPSAGDAGGARLRGAHGRAGGVLSRLEDPAAVHRAGAPGGADRHGRALSAQAQRGDGRNRPPRHPAGRGPGDADQARGPPRGARRCRHGGQVQRRPCHGDRQGDPRLGARARDAAGAGRQGHDPLHRQHDHRRDRPHRGAAPRQAQRFRGRPGGVPARRHLRGRRGARPYRRRHRLDQHFDADAARRRGLSRHHHRTADPGHARAVGGVRQPGGRRRRIRKGDNG